MSSSSESCYEYSSESEASSSEAGSDSDTDYNVTSDSLDMEPTTISSPEPVKVKVKHPKHKTVKKVKRKKDKSKVSSDRSYNELTVTPKKKRKVKNWERVLNLKSSPNKIRVKLVVRNVNIVLMKNKVNTMRKKTWRKLKLGKLEQWEEVGV